MSSADWLTSGTEEAYGVYVSVLGRKPMPMTMDYLATLDDINIWIAELEGNDAEGWYCSMNQIKV